MPVDGGKALRISNAFTSGSFGDMPHSVPVTRPASENDANNRLVNEFTIQAPQTYAPGLGVTFSPDEGLGSRMSRVRFEDRGDAGLHVLFADASFEDQDIATLDRTSPHNVKIETTFVKGDTMSSVSSSTATRRCAPARGRTTTATLRSATRPRADRPALSVRPASCPAHAR